MKNKAFKEMEPLFCERWGKEKTEQIMKIASQRFSWLCQQNIADSKAVKQHTEKNLFPCISLYESMQKCGIPKEEALDFLDISWSKRAEKGANSTRKILKFAGLYKLYPAIFKWVAKNQFGTAAGFQADFYDCGKQRCKFDMKKCLFCDTCERYECPELTKCFCHVDDINNKDLHPRLCWNRTQFMGEGKDFCDFDIFVQEEKK